MLSKYVQHAQIFRTYAQLLPDMHHKYTAIGLFIAFVYPYSPLPVDYCLLPVEHEIGLGTQSDRSNTQQIISTETPMCLDTIFEKSIV